MSTPLATRKEQGATFQKGFRGSDGANSRTSDDNRVAVHQCCFPVNRQELNSVGATDADMESVSAKVLLGIFQEVLRRYTGQKSVSVSFQENNSALRPVAFETGYSIRQIVARLEQGHNPGTLSSGEGCDGQFSFLTNEFSGEARRQKTITAIHWAVRFSCDTLTGWVEFERNNWSSATIEGFLSSCQRLLREALARPDASLDQLDILSDSDLEQVADWNNTRSSYPLLRVDQLFDIQAAKTPQSPALSFEGQTLSYSLLAERTNKLAARLRSLGVGPGALAGICMERCLDMVVAMLAVLKAGGAYLPLDAAFPTDRIAFMLEDARPLVVITQEHLRETLPPADSRVICLDSEPDNTSESENASHVPLESGLDNLAYLLYTSGSTGRPKGVQIAHRGLTNLLSHVASKVDLTACDVFLATSTISFDVSVFEIFAPLISGAHLVVAARSVAVSGDLLSEAIRMNGATMMQATPSGWRILLESGWVGHTGLKMLTAGEPLDRTLANRLLERGSSLWNLYGPTEATIYATGIQITEGQTKVTIGKPLANYTTWILDSSLKPVPAGAIGELYLGGVGLAIGYLNRPDLTAERFVSVALATGPEMRLYRTGDLARFLPNGEIEVLGRIDNQVKLRGYRIELEEIESLLDSHPAVHKAVARLVSLGEDDQRLIAYIVPNVSGPVDEKSLREHANSKLPWYMVPASFVAMPSFALTPGGKVDRKALPIPSDLFSLKPGEVLYRDKASLEETVLECWRSVLSLPHLDLDDNFFEVGGHSLLAVRMFTEIGTKLDCKIPVSCLIEAPTARAFADRLRNADDATPRCMVRMQPKGTLPPIYLIHHLLGDILVYRAMAECFAPDRQVYGIQAPTDFVTRSHPFSLVSLASEYVKEILHQQPAGPFHLAGYSSGSVLAFEMARQLKEAGHEIGLLGLIDGDIKNPGMPPIPVAVKYWKIFVRKMCKIVFKFMDELSEGPKLFVSKRLGYLLFLWRMRNLERSPTPPDSTQVTLEQSLLLCENAYRPQPYAGSALLLRFHDEAWRFGPNPLMGWSGLVQGGIEAIDVPGGHMTGMTPEGAPLLAELLKARIERCEAKKQDPNALLKSVGQEI